MVLEKYFEISNNCGFDEVCFVEGGKAISDYIESETPAVLQTDYRDEGLSLNASKEVYNDVGADRAHVLDGDDVFYGIRFFENEPIDYSDINMDYVERISEKTGVNFKLDEQEFVVYSRHKPEEDLEKVEGVNNIMDYIYGRALVETEFT